MKVKPSHFKNLKTSGLDCLTSLAACLVWALGTAPTCHSPFPLQTMSAVLSLMD